MNWKKIKPVSITLGQIALIAEETGFNWLDQPIDELGDISIVQIAQTGWILFDDQMNFEDEDDYIHSIDGEGILVLLQRTVESLVNFFVKVHPERAAMLISVFLISAVQGMQMFEELAKSVDGRFAFLSLQSEKLPDYDYDASINRLLEALHDSPTSED